MTTTTGRKRTMFNLQCSPGDGLKVHHVVVSCTVCPQAPGLEGAEHDAIQGPVAGLVLLLHQAYHAGDVAAADPGQEEHYLVEEVRSYLEGSIRGFEEGLCKLLAESSGSKQENSCLPVFIEDVLFLVTFFCLQKFKINFFN